MNLRHTLLLAAALAVLPGAAFASHGKAGLWSTTTTMTMNGMPPQTHSATFCMTSEQVKADAPPASENHDCSYINTRASGHTMTADMVCKGRFEAKGHFTTTYDSDTHYTAHMSIETSGMTMNNAVEGKWLKADCAGATH